MSQKHPDKRGEKDTPPYSKAAIARLREIARTLERKPFGHYAENLTLPSWREKFGKTHQVEETLPSNHMGLLKLLKDREQAHVKTDFGSDFWAPSTVPSTADLLTSEFLQAARICSWRERKQRQQKGMFLQGLREGRILTKFCYEAAALAPGHEVTDSVHAALLARGHAVDITKATLPGLQQHNSEVITRPEYPMRAVTSSSIENHSDFLQPLIHERIIIEWGPGDGTHLANLIKKCGDPALVVLVDRSQINLDQSRAKLIAAGYSNDRIVTICDDFYNPDLFTKHDIFRLVKDSGIAITNIIFGGTLWNYTEKQRTPFLAKLHELCSTPPRNGGRHAMLTTNDWTQDIETNVRAYLNKAYEKFYWMGMVWAGVLENFCVNLSHLHVDVEKIPEGYLVGLRSTSLHFVSPCNPFVKDRFSTDAPEHRNSLVLKKRQLLEATRAERPTPIRDMAQFHGAGWQKATLEGADWQMHTFPHRDEHNPLARTGMNIFYPELAAA